MKKFIFILPFLLSLNVFATENRCDEFDKNLQTSFPEDSKHQIHLKNEKDYQKMKSELSKVTIDQLRIDQYLNNLNDEKYLISDVTGAFEIFRATCMFVEFKAINSLFEYTKEHPKLEKDFISLLKDRIQNHKNTPSLVLFLIEAANAKKIIELKDAQNSQVEKDLEVLIKKAKSDSKRLSEALAKGMKEGKKDEDYSVKEVMDLEALSKEEAALSQQYFKELNAFITKI